MRKKSLLYLAASALVSKYIYDKKRKGEPDEQLYVKLNCSDDRPPGTLGPFRNMEEVTKWYNENEYWSGIESIEVIRK